MAIVKMKRLRLIALKSQKDDLLASLLRVGCVEVTEPGEKLSDPEWTRFLRKDTTVLSDVRAKANKLSSAMDSLKEYAHIKGGFFEARPFIDESDFLSRSAMESALEAAAKINDYTHEISKIYSKENRLTGMKLGFKPWETLDLPVETDSTETTKIILGVFPAAVEAAQARAALAEAAPMAELIPVSADKEQSYHVLTVHKSQVDEAIASLRRFSFGVTNFKGSRGTPAENIVSIDKQIAEAVAERKKLADEIASMADRSAEIKMCIDRMNQEIEKQLASENFLTDGTVSFFEGWAPVPDIPKLEKELESFICAIELADPAEDETPPTQLRNNKVISAMNMVTEMYSLPAYDGIDPNPLIFPFFTIFFGMMYADVAYGIILIILSQIIIRKVRPKGGMGNIMKLATLCGITAAVWGFLSGGIFGDAYTVIMETFFNRPDEMLYVPVIDLLSNPMNVLYLALVMGAIQLFTGQIIRIYMGFRDHEPLEGILDVVPWWIVFAGIGVLVLNGSSTVILAGVAALVLTQGRHKKGIVGKFFGGIASLYDVTSWLGDILSYTRLMALMLAGTVIASVFNILGTLPGNFLVFIVVFIIGHAFNMGINIIGTYVHAARLQYLEFFSKFYKEGGIPFNPLRYNTKYVDVVTKEV